MIARMAVPLLLAVTLAPAAAGFAFATPTEGTPRSVAFRVLAQWTATEGPCTNTCWLVLKSQQQLEQFWSVSNTGSPPSVNFSRDALVVIGLGGVGNAYSTAVTRVVRVGNELQVHVRTHMNFGVVVGLGSPVEIIEVPRPFRDVQFIDQEDTIWCQLTLLEVCQTVTGSMSNAATALVQPRPPCRNPVPPDDVTDVTCYRAGKVTTAETLLHPHGIDPSAAVTRITHLRLHRVIVANWAYYGLHPTWQPYVVIFHYGTAPATMANIDFGRRSPTFVEVAETSILPAYVPPAQPLLVQSLLHLGVKDDPPSNGSIVRGPWELEARIPHHKLWITVAADGSRSTVRKLGLSILRTLG